MKRLILSLFFFSTGYCAMSQAPFIIEGYVPSVPDSTELRLYLNETRALEPVSSARVIGGKFSFTYPVTEKTKMAIIGTSEIFPQMILRVWAEPGVTAKIAGDDNLYFTWPIDSPVPEQQEWEYYRQLAKPEWDEFQKMDITYANLYRLNTDSREREKLREESRRLQDSIQYVIYEKLLPILLESEPTPLYFDQLIGMSEAVRHNNSFSGLRDEALILFDRLTPEQKASPEGKEILVSLSVTDRVQIGDPMADAELVDPAGNWRRLSDFKGKYILLDFWASWCGPCIASIPELKEAAKRYKDDLTIIGISLDEKTVDWLEAVKKHEIQWINLHAQPEHSGIAVQYGVNGIPLQVIISPEGVVLGSWVGYQKGHVGEKLEGYIPQRE